MTSPRRVDANHAAIVRAFRALGCSVQSLAALGKGVPDLLVGCDGKNHLIEVKAGKGKPTPDQVDWALAWLGDNPVIVRTEAHATAWVTLWRER